MTRMSHWQVPFRAAAPPSEESVRRLMDMGFGRDEALAALSASDNNEEHAVHRLLSGTT